MFHLALIGIIKSQQIGREGKLSRPRSIFNNISIVTINNSLKRHMWSKLELKGERKAKWYCNDFFNTYFKQLHIIE